MTERKPRVFIVQLPMAWNATKTERVAKFDFSDAAEHGELVYLLTPSANPNKLGPIIAELNQTLQSYDYDAGDSLLLVGSPVLMGVVSAIAADVSQGYVRFLQWTKNEGGRYVSMEAENIFGY